MAQDLKPRLISPADTGGLPVFNDDILQTQDNNRFTSIEHFEFLRSNINNNTGKLLFPIGAGTTDEWDVGLVISGCVIDKTVASPYPISEGYVYIDGEVLKFPAGTTVTSTQWVQLTKGSATNTQRTFKDGSPKNATIEYDLTVTVLSYSPYGPSPSVPNTTQIIAIEDIYTSMQTIQGAVGLISQGGNVTQVRGLFYYYDNPSLTSATLEAYTTGLIRSRVKEIYTNEVIINATVETSTFLDATKEYVIATLVDWTADAEINTVAYLRGTTPDLDVTSLIRVLTNGQVILRQPLGNTTWISIAGSTIYTINVSATITNEVLSPYNGYDTNFMTKS